MVIFRQHISILRLYPVLFIMLVLVSCSPPPPAQEVQITPLNSPAFVDTVDTASVVQAETEVEDTIEAQVVDAVSTASATSSLTPTITLTASNTPFNGIIPTQIIPSPTQPVTETWYIISVQGANIRSCASISCDILGWLPYRADFEWIQEVDVFVDPENPILNSNEPQRWHQITLPDDFIFIDRSINRREIEYPDDIAYLAYFLGDSVQPPILPTLTPTILPTTTFTETVIIVANNPTPRPAVATNTPFDTPIPNSTDTPTPTPTDALPGAPVMTLTSSFMGDEQPILITNVNDGVVVSFEVIDNLTSAVLETFTLTANASNQVELPPGDPMPFRANFAEGYRYNQPYTLRASIPITTPDTVLDSVFTIPNPVLDVTPNLGLLTDPRTIILQDFEEDPAGIVATLVDCQTTTVTVDTFTIPIDSSGIGFTNFDPSSYPLTVGFCYRVEVTTPGTSNVMSQSVFIQ